MSLAACGIRIDGKLQSQAAKNGEDSEMHVECDTFYSSADDAENSRDLAAGSVWPYRTEAGFLVGSMVFVG
ncbi:hypothetical protein [Nocardia otitidiscaviarum]|uniref:hypothetical protein n=1 Tax=Nocardia otitidiscaviarum TaxID=1823 RepID=UPI001894484A|nr:hypothetical protein [Nocardia otitidiscaviarum]MBF6183349.1 hypothetical protein [Nocardia otitidiscaviarum]